MTVGTIAELAGAAMTSGAPDAVVTGVSVDTRTLAPGDLFVALSSEARDGHHFLTDAVTNGAAALLVRPGTTAPAGAAVVAVDDPAAGLLRLAGAYRARLQARVVAITGSSGKTITKELTAAVARAAFNTVASAASFNNEIGVPLTILAADASTEILVAEVGARRTEARDAALE
jgi:UDP-N-acetylmuramoyl-tripeptide--D-alanyl-D-alanine ligase